MAAASSPRAFRVGIVSDTHGVLPASAHRVLAGVDHVLHAGDVGDTRVIDQLETIAPVTAVAGNCEQGRTRWLPHVADIELGGVRFLVGHIRADLVREVDPVVARVRVVVSGHTHRSRVERVGEVLFVNPGTAGQARGGGLSCAIVTVDGAGGVEAEIRAL